jgi:hypothetical protein
VLNKRRHKKSKSASSSKDQKPKRNAWNAFTHDVSALVPKAMRSGENHQAVWKQISSGVGKAAYAKMKADVDRSENPNGMSYQALYGDRAYKTIVRDTANKIVARISG